MIEPPFIYKQPYGAFKPVVFRPDEKDDSIETHYFYLLSNISWMLRRYYQAGSHHAIVYIPGNEKFIFKIIAQNPNIKPDRIDQAFAAGALCDLTNDLRLMLSDFPENENIELAISENRKMADCSFSKATSPLFGLARLGAIKRVESGIYELDSHGEPTKGMEEIIENTPPGMVTSSVLDMYRTPTRFPFEMKTIKNAIDEQNGTTTQIPAIIPPLYAEQASKLYN